MNIVAVIFSAINSIFNFLTGRSNANNAADVKAGQKAKDETVAVDKTNKAIEQRNTKEIQNEISE